MIGDLSKTLAGWSVQPPTECVNGHQSCTCRGSHIGWRCRTCDAAFFSPPTDADVV
jgi:hypothetical protein